MDTITLITSTFNEFGTSTLFTLGTANVTLYRVLGLIFILVFAWWASALVERTIWRVARRGNETRLSDSGVYALSRILRYFLWIVGSIMGLVWLGFDLGSLAIMGGAIGVGIGFGLQNIFSNFISGIIILVEQTLKVGDFVDLQSGIVGTVTEISMRYTRVTTNDSVDIIVPNSEFINGRVTNWTLDEAVRRIHIPFGVAYGTSKELVREAAIAAALTVNGTVNNDRRAPDVWLVKFGDSSLDFELVVWVEKSLMTSPGSTHARFLWAIETELVNRNIEIPFPQRDLHVRSGKLSVHLEGANQQIKSD
ncbi:mechanosensitive ion channel family protein [Sulfurirhabdus autotrophica]|uniref:Mechanosensitive ion channel-like protein n=1 Tax=Sulfurirhabdus autotrophica TaxID=1706046 RepID=A0A4R3YAS7_9PROT|nr:mechanosensitive ion channel domain-containing protein [Sulfurirhabdus autotrophica]TCV89056.1 mechanosensitive ion channel-like protein [Sulfurirhabdus autotrophica]